MRGCRDSQQPCLARFYYVLKFTRDFYPKGGHFLKYDKMSKTKSKTEYIFQIMKAHLYLSPPLYWIIRGFLVQIARQGSGDSATLVVVGDTYCEANTD